LVTGITEGKLSFLAGSTALSFFFSEVLKSLMPKPPLASALLL